MNKDSIREYLRITHTEADLQTWFDPLRLHLADAGSIAVGFPHPFFARWFTKERRKYFEGEVTRALGYSPRFVYERPFSLSAQHGALLKFCAEGPLNPPQTASEGLLWSFDTFLYNKKNEFPVTMAREVAGSAENSPYTPFIICGKGGCGKTHLLRAMAGAMAAAIAPSSIFVCTVAELAASHSTTQKTGALAHQINNYQALFIDNVQDLTRYPELQHELVLVLDTFREKKKPLVLALDHSPVDQALIDPKLTSRLEGGLSVTLKKPDLDIRLRYARAQCSANRLQLNKEMLLPIAQRFQSLPAIQGILAKIAAYQKGSGSPLTQTDLEKIIANEPLSAMPVTPVSIIGRVAETFGVSPEELSGNGRSAKVVRARQVAMYVCRKLLGVSLTSLGAYFGGKNHATVIYSCKKIELLLESDKNMHKLVTQIRKKFASSPG